MSQRPNPSGIRKTSSRIRSGTSTPARAASPPRATDPDAVCALKPHIWDHEDFHDRHLPLIGKQWEECQFHPCPNRCNIECPANLILEFGRRTERGRQEDFI